MNREQILQDAEYARHMAEHWRAAPMHTALAGTCEEIAGHYDRLEAYARRALNTPQSELVRLTDALTAVTAERDALKKSFRVFGRETVE